MTRSPKGKGRGPGDNARTRRFVESLAKDLYRRVRLNAGSWEAVEYIIRLDMLDAYMAGRYAAGTKGPTGRKR